MSNQHGSFERRLKHAVRAFWTGRTEAAEKQRAYGRQDQGNRAAVTGGRNLDAFRDLIEEIVKRKGPKGTMVHRNKAVVTLPGYFRPAKQWDIVATCEDRLLTVIELKSLCGPSFGNNANNRCEEALGSALDFRKAQSEGAFGAGASPFLGYFILVEDAEGSATPVMVKSPHFAIDAEFQNASYQCRMRILCERMMEQQLYTSAATLTSPASAARNGISKNLSDSTSIHRFVSRLTGHLIGES